MYIYSFLYGDRAGHWTTNDYELISSGVVHMLVLRNSPPAEDQFNRDSNVLTQFSMILLLQRGNTYNITRTNFATTNISKCAFKNLSK